MLLTFSEKNFFIIGLTVYTILSITGYFGQLLSNIHITI